MREVTKITKRVPVHTDLDVIMARMRAREIAREMGFGTIDQARISLAAGELARVLANNIVIDGEIVISGINSQGQMGIQVISVSPKNKLVNRASAEPADSQGDDLAKVIALVDEGMVEDEGQQGTRVTLMKWLS